MATIVAESASDPKKTERFLSDLETLAANGDITQQEYDNTKAQFNTFVEAKKTVPTTVTNVEDVARATELIVEQKEVEQELEQVNPAMAEPLKSKLADINNELTEIAVSGYESLRGGGVEYGKSQTKKIKTIWEIVAETKNKKDGTSAMEAAKERFKEAKAKGELERIRKEEEAKEYLQQQRDAREKEIEEVAKVRADVNDSDLLLIDLPNSIERLQDRIDANIPSDNVLIEEALGALAKKFDELMQYKKDPHRTHTNEVIDSVIDLLSDVKTEIQLYQEQLLDYEKSEKESATAKDSGKPDIATTSIDTKPQSKPTAEPVS